MKRIRQFFHDTKSVWTGRGTYAQRLRLWVDYTKVSFLLFAEGRFMKTPESIRFLGFTVYTVSLSEFFMSVREIFVQHPYAFRVDTENPVIVDCGANIGDTILYFKYWHPHAEIHAFEPDPQVFEVLKKNVEENNLDSVYLHQVALGDTDGTVQFFSREGMSLASTIVHIEGKRESATEVVVRRLSEFMPNRVDLLKVDVQLSEGAIFRDLRQSGMLARAENILMEYHYLPGYEGNALDEILNSFDEQGILYKLSLNTMLGDGFATYTIRAGTLSHVLYE